MATSEIEQLNLQETKQGILLKSLGGELFDKVKSFFSYLFVVDDTKKPLANRRYIVLTRKGFSLCQAAMVCGLCGDGAESLVGKLISDRNWRKMTIKARQEFTEGFDVFIVDDTTVTGHNCLNIYYVLDARICKSRNVVVLNSGYSFTHRESFQNYKEFERVSIEKRREENAKITVALYNLAIPFTAESPIFHTLRLERKILKAWMDLDGSAKSKMWKYESADLNLGSAGIVRTSFLIHAPKLQVEAENILFRGVRVCYRLLEKHEDPSQDYAEVTVVPWIIFDIIDYQKAIDYLLGLDDRTPELREQLINGETNRKRIITHRVIAHLFSACIKNEFFTDIATAWNNDTLYNTEKFHYSENLFKEITILIEHGCGDTGSRVCPYHNLLMSKNEHETAVSASYSKHLKGLSVPDYPKSIDKLADELCIAREPVLERESGYLKKPSFTNSFPLLCYTGENLGTKSLEYVRSTIASFHSALIPLNGQIYLAITLVSGEGSNLAMVKNYDFIWAIHHLSDQKINFEMKKFVEFWNERREQLSEVSPFVSQICEEQDSRFWPSRQEIWKSFPDDVVLIKAEALACEFDSIEAQ